MKAGIELRGAAVAGQERVFTPEALAFVAELERRFGPDRRALLERRDERLAALAAGERFDFLPETREVREGEWRVAAAPADLDDRRVEITGPVERKMMINALNCGARVFMADFEDSLSPTWSNVVEGQINLLDAVRRQLHLVTPEKEYRLGERLATLLVRPRGWHLEERHALLDGRPVSASLWDFGLYFVHNAGELLARGSGPYLYLAKLESHREARLWNQVFDFAEEAAGVPRGSIRATVLIETLPAAFEMEEILFELRDHAAGLNAGRWDYIFSILRKLRDHAPLFPDRAQVTMEVPFMRAYTDLLVRTCHRRGAHAIGGMAAFIPSRRDRELNETALARVREDKEREVGDGFDGTWVAHPDLVPVAQQVFDRVLGARPHQKERRREEVRGGADALLDFRVPGGEVSERGVRNNLTVALQYLDSWLRGIGAAAILNLMEDTATAEISRSQLWQWVRKEAALPDGRRLTRELYRAMRGEELAALGGPGTGRLGEAAELLDALVLAPDFIPFLTNAAYERLD
jgi:malate synthase